jgi:hypothetical protein
VIIRLPRQLLRPEIILQRRRRPLSNEARLARYLAFVLLVCLAAYVYLLPASRTVAVHAQIRQVSSDYETQLTANAETIIAISRYTNMTALTARARQKGFELPASPVFVPVPGTPGGPLASGLQLDERAPAAAPVGANSAHAATR